MPEHEMAAVACILAYRALPMDDDLAEACRLRFHEIVTKNNISRKRTRELRNIAETLYIEN